MTVRVEKSEVQFLNEGPHGQFDEVYRCFEGDHNGLLFRLVDTEKKTWSFYNDTTDTVMKVKAIFKEGSKVEPLRTSKLSERTNEQNEVELIIEAEVHPGFTQQFMRGTANGFEIEFQTEAAPATDVEFVNGKPTKRYNKIYRCFKNNGNGLFFRLVDDASNTWYFYNDTTGYSMVATVEFADRESITSVGNAEEVGVPADHPNGVILRIAVAPCQTEAFIVGKPVNYRMSYSADPVNNDQPEDPRHIRYESPEGPDSSVIDARNAKIYRCFKKNGNGLLFRMVDEDRKEWAFYNDTEHYVMTANVRFPQDEVFQPSDRCTVSEDPESAGVTVVSMEIGPHETHIFIHGNPKNFETSYAAESVNRSKPEENPQYRNGEPDSSVMEYTQVNKVVKDNNSEDGILYRLFDVDKKKWGFYNDTNDVTVTARVKFNDGASIKKLGNTRTDSDESGAAGGIFYVVEVPPLATVEFIEGDYDSFESKFTGIRRVTPRPSESQQEESVEM